jgi:hypothetical protein
MEEGGTNFYITSLSYIDKIMLADVDNNFTGEMKKIKHSHGIPFGQSIFNGTIKGDKAIGLMLSGRLTTNYIHNDIFSIPLDNRLLQELIDNNDVFSNTIIVNAPENLMEKVIIKFPEFWRTFWSIPEYMFPRMVPIDKIKFDWENGGQPSDYFKVGIDPEASIFIGSVDMKPPSKEYLSSLTEEDIHRMMENKIKVICYTQSKKIEIIKKGDTVEVF